MKSLVTRVSGPDSTEIIILPPAGSRVPQQFRNVISNATAYQSVLAQIQNFRGQIYLEDGAITTAELAPDGRHVLPIDQRSWHVMSVEKNGEIGGCLRFLEESADCRFEDLWLHSAALTSCPSLGAKVRRAVEDKMARAREERLRFGEVGGWAVSNCRRGSWEALRIVLSTYGLLQLLGGCIGLATATVRHGSAGILRKIGLASLWAGDTAVPPYYEPRYGCLMEMLTFDSRRANGKFMGWIEELSSHLTTASVIWSGQPAPISSIRNGVTADPVLCFAESAVA